MMNFLRKQMKWVMAIIVIAFLLSTFLMYEGRSTRRTPERNADGTMTDYEVAQINGRSLMRSELERRVRDYLSNSDLRNADTLEMPVIYQAVLNQAILESQLSKAVEDSGIRVSDAEADQAMKAYADTYFPTRETFYQALANSGIRVEDYKRNLARQIALDRLLTGVIGEIEVSEDKAVEFYDTMKGLIYARPEGFMVHAANFNKESDAEILRGKLLAGESWDIIVSNDELASVDIINMTREPVFLPTSAFTGAFEVFTSLDVGVISPVFEVTSSDFAVGLKTSHVDASTVPYDEVSGDIKTLLLQQEQRNKLAAYEESLINSAQVVIYDESLFARLEVTSPDNAVVIEEPAIVIEEVQPEETTEAKTEEATEELKPEATEVKTEEVKPEETPEVKTEEAKSEATEVTEAKTEPATEEPKSEVTEVKTEEATEEIKPEVTEAKTEEAKPEETSEVKTEEAKPAETTETTEVTEVTEAKTEPTTEQPKTEEAIETTEQKPETK